MTTPNNGHTALGRITSIDTEVTQEPAWRNSDFLQRALELAFNIEDVAVLAGAAERTLRYLDTFDDYISKQARLIGREFCPYVSAKIVHDVLYLNVYRGQITSDDPQDCMWIKPFSDYENKKVWFTYSAAGYWKRDFRRDFRIVIDPDKYQIHTRCYIYKDPVFSIALNRPE